MDFRIIFFLLGLIQRPELMSAIPFADFAIFWGNEQSSRCQR